MYFYISVNDFCCISYLHMIMGNNRNRASMNNLTVYHFSFILLIKKELLQLTSQIIAAVYDSSVV